MTQKTISVKNHPDATLIELGKTFDKLHESYWSTRSHADRVDPSAKDDRLGKECDHAFVRLIPVLRRIQETNASTPIGLRVKMRAVAYCLSFDDKPLNELAKDVYTYPGIVYSLIQDLLKQHGIEPQLPR